MIQPIPEYAAGAVQPGPAELRLKINEVVAWANDCQRWFDMFDQLAGAAVRFAAPPESPEPPEAVGDYVVTFRPRIGPRQKRSMTLKEAELTMREAINRVDFGATGNSFTVTDPDGNDQTLCTLMDIDRWATRRKRVDAVKNEEATDGGSN